MKHQHEFKKTGAIQTSYFGIDIDERHEWKCEVIVDGFICGKTAWLEAGMTPRCVKSPSAKENRSQSRLSFRKNIRKSATGAENPTT